MQRATWSNPMSTRASSRSGSARLSQPFCWIPFPKCRIIRHNLVIVRTEAYAPGRVELLGNHTDYNGGIVLGAAIDRGLTVTGRRREAHVIRISSARRGTTWMS